MTVHINAPRGTYIAQIREVGCRRWTTVPGSSKTAERAMVKAIQAMTSRSWRARVLFTVEWYEPLIVMQANRK